jgi:large subunit ribosomal protein L24
VKHLIRTGDEVQVIRGAESGRRTPPPEGDAEANPAGERGRVRRVLRDQGRLIVDRVRIVKKATRPDPRKGHRGGFVEREAAIPISNVMLVCRKCDRPVRARRARNAEGKKVRICRRCGGEI